MLIKETKVLEWHEIVVQLQKLKETETKQPIVDRKPFQVVPISQKKITEITCLSKGFKTKDWWISKLFTDSKAKISSI